MRTLGNSLSGLTFAGLFCMALTTGCPVWDGGDGRTGTTTPPPPVDSGLVVTCSSNTECPAGFCDRASMRCTSAVRCMTAAQCPTSYLCDNRGLCVPGGCGADSECAALGTGLVCNATSHTCTPGGACTSDAQCASTPSTPVCLGGSCQPRTSQCQFDYQCTGAGQSCVDGRCVVGCNTAANCAAGQTCTAGRCVYPTTGSCSTPCPTGQVCASGACLATCVTDASCASGFMCDHGVCRVDTRPRPFCTMDSECNRDSICYNGACRRLCPMPSVTPDGDCMRVDVQFNLCRADGMGRSLCTSTNEQMPQCARSADCTMGRMCVNARCQ
jgi:hypothetical protein